MGSDLETVASGNSALAQRPLPHELDAERLVLGSILLDPHMFAAVIRLLDREEYFYLPAHQKIYTAMLSLFNDAQPVDLHLLRNELKTRGQLEEVGGGSYIASLVESCPVAANAEFYATIVRDRFVVRKLIQAATQTIQECYSGSESVEALVDRAEQRVFEVGQKKDLSEDVRIEQALYEAFEVIDNYKDREGRLTGLASGFMDLDEKTCGFQNSELIILAARPSMGKTSFALNVIENVGIELGKAVAIFSIEVPRRMLVQNMLCSRGRIDSHKLRGGYLQPEEYSNLSMVAGDFKDAGIFINDSPSMTVMSLRARARRLKDQYDISMIVIDYLQLMEGSVGAGGRTESRQQEISLISRGLKSLARELEVPVIALSQLNRRAETRDDHRPRMADLRESGALEQDADVIMFLFREEYYDPRPENENVAELIIAKQRHGPTDTVKLTFMKQFTRFYNYSRRDEGF